MAHKPDYCCADTCEGCQYTESCNLPRPREIALVACCSKKLDHPAIAQDLYASQWFKAASNFIRRGGHVWYILSAKHGLVNPLRVIEPYDDTLNTMPIPRRWEWGNRVTDQLLEELHCKEEPPLAGKKFTILAGSRYVEFLGKNLVDLGAEVNLPLKSLGIGQQLSYLKKG